jgi:hypothetical protein
MNADKKIHADAEMDEMKKMAGGNATWNDMTKAAGSHLKKVAGIDQKGGSRRRKVRKSGKTLRRKKMTMKQRQQQQRQQQQRQQRRRR